MKMTAVQLYDTNTKLYKDQITGIWPYLQHSQKLKYVYWETNEIKSTPPIIYFSLTRIVNDLKSIFIPDTKQVLFERTNFLKNNCVNWILIEIL